MPETKRGLIAVIFVSRRTPVDMAGYAAAAQEMGEEAARQPGYAGIESVRDADGNGITISYWESEEAAIAWRANRHHSQIRALGRAQWYDSYEVVVAAVTRDYRWAADR